MDPLPEDYLSPPPAYSEQEFDQKISRATELSIQTAKWETPVVDEDGWPQYDPATFEDGRRTPRKDEYRNNNSENTSMQASSSSSSTGVNKTDQAKYNNTLPSIIPLRIEKKSLSQSKPGQELAYSVGPSLVSSPVQRSSKPQYSDGLPSPATFLSNLPKGSSRYNEQISEYHSSPLHPDPPPQFNAHPESSNLPMHHAAPEDHDGRHSLVDSYYHSSQDSQPLLSPLDFPLVNQFSQSLATAPSDNRDSLVDPYYHVSPVSPRHSLPVPNRPQVALPDRPISSYFSSHVEQQAVYVPRVNFNPYTAYGNTSTSVQTSLPPVERPKIPIQYDAHSLYNSSVSSKLVPIARTTPDPTHLPSYNQPRQYHSRPSQHYPSYNNNSYGNALTVQHSQSSLGANSRQSPYQPSRPLSTYSMMSDTSYGGSVSDPTRFSQYSNNTTSYPRTGT